ncbi:Golgi reassembly-stacking protein 1 isoform X2 [Esox lucius]|uniref:Golgi reassembly-stacking protein 1 isoform X2 n=1 Tax=Esox lucius TaxID=8010 RepID=UPI000661C97F|nr:Golgi reassembly-stacking protein 1 isoform X2 [Esox lucius]
MGITQSSIVSDGRTSGYHVHGVQVNSPAHHAGLEPFFDFILSVGNTRLNRENDLLKDLLKANVEKPVRLEVWSSKALRVRELEVVPSNMWGGQGLLGASVRFCSFQGANENVWHVLDVEPNSPAALAGLQAHEDYVVGADQVLQDSEDFFSLIESSEGRPLKLLVYNTQTDLCREVVVTPNGAWGGEGSLGCGIGYGYLHRIPTRPVHLSNQNCGAVPSPEDNSRMLEISAGHVTEVPLISLSSQAGHRGDQPVEDPSPPSPVQRVLDPDSSSSTFEALGPDLSKMDSFSEVSQTTSGVSMLTSDGNMSCHQHQHSLLEECSVRQVIPSSPEECSESQVIPSFPEECSVSQVIPSSPAGLLGKSVPGQEGGEMCLDHPDVGHPNPLDRLSPPSGGVPTAARDLVIPDPTNDTLTHKSQEEDVDQEPGNPVTPGNPETSTQGWRGE